MTTNVRKFTSVGDVFRHACPSWPTLDCVRSGNKLKDVGIDSVQALAESLLASGMHHVNAKLKVKGLKSYKGETLLALQKTLFPDFDSSQASFETERLEDFLFSARPMWSDQERESALTKLALVGIADVRALNRCLTLVHGSLNAVLLSVGSKQFTLETLASFRSTLNMWGMQSFLLSPDLRDALKAACPDWGPAQFEAAEQKLAAVGVKNVNTFKTIVGAKDPKLLNSRLARYGFKGFSKETMMILRVLTQVDSVPFWLRCMGRSRQLEYGKSVEPQMMQLCDVESANLDSITELASAELLEDAPDQSCEFFRSDNSEDEGEEEASENGRTLYDSDWSALTVELALGDPQLHIGFDEEELFSGPNIESEGEPVSSTLVDALAASILDPSSVVPTETPYSCIASSGEPTQDSPSLGSMSMGDAKQSTKPMPEKHVIVPMGHYCPTAAFLNQHNLRQFSLPLDWCCATFKVWRRMLEDNYTSLLAAPQDDDPSGRNHPYNQLFSDTLMFLHQRDWAKAGETRRALERRTQRLKNILDGERAFGLSFYFSGQENVHATFDEVVADGCALSRGHGFSHVAMVWFDSYTVSHPCGYWISCGKSFSALRYRPYRRMGWGVELHVKDSATIATLLSRRFPQVFVLNRSVSMDSDEEDADMLAGADENWDELWDFERGHLRSGARRKQSSSDHN